MTPIDPTTVWLSDHILLSDLVGCDSVYRFGIANPVYDTDTAKINEGRYLARTIDEYISERAVSFTYGYICPALSRAIVKYQNPNKPSYHRWDKGAACDMVIHTTDQLFQNPRPQPAEYETRQLAWGHYPLDELHLMHTENGISWSRAITYAGSDIFCFATQLSEGDNPRMATYENRYTGPHKKPDFQKITPEFMRDGGWQQPGDWRGRGWPYTHGGGRRQYEHVRTGLYTVLSDFLYDSISTHKGRPNKPPIGRQQADNFMLNVMFASVTYEHIVNHLATRIPIVGAYVNPAARRTRIDRSYQNRFVLDLKAPHVLDPDEIAGAAESFTSAVDIVETLRGNRVRIVGVPIELAHPGNNRAWKTTLARLQYERNFFKQGIRA